MMLLRENVEFQKVGIKAEMRETELTLGFDEKKQSTNQFHPRKVEPRRQNPPSSVTAGLPAGLCRRGGVPPGRCCLLALLAW